MSLVRLLDPRGIALVGASDDLSRYGGRALRYALGSGFAGGIFPVNPRAAALQGVPCHASVEAIPDPVDVVVALVGPARLPDLIERCRARGDVAVVVVVGAIVEDGPGRARRIAHLKALAGPVRLLGPMSVGVIVPPIGAAMTISSGWPGGPVAPGGVAVVSQSGGILGAVLDRARLSGVGFSALVSTGEEADVTTAELVEMLADHAPTRSIAVYAEGFDDPARFLAAADRAREAGKPVLLLSPGRTAAGVRAALSHSGRIAGDAEVLAAACRRRGIVQVGDIDDLHVTADALSRIRVRAGTGVGAMSLSGGFAATIADALAAAGVPLPPLAEATVARIRAGGYQARPANPVDAAGRPDQGDVLADTRHCLAALDADPAVGVTLFAETVFLGPEAIVPHLIEHARSSRGPLVVCWQAGPSVRSILADLRAAGIVAVDEVATAARLLKALVDRAAYRPEPAPPAPPRFALPPASGPLDADAAAAMLAAFGIARAPASVVPLGGDLGAPARDLGFPLALKGRVPGVVHKTERRLVALDLRDEASLRAAAAAMVRGNPDLAAFELQRMVSGLEVLVGVKRVPGLGAAVILGFGGILAEAMDVRAVEIAPFGGETAAAMVARVDRRGLLAGVRGGPPLARAALVETLVAVSRLAHAVPRLAELDLNPVIVAADGAWAVDVVAVPAG